MKKITIIMILVLLVALLAVPAAAAGSASLAPSASTVYRGDTLTVAIKLSGMDKCTAGSVSVTYGSGLQLTGGTTSISGLSLTPDLAKGRFIFYNMSPTDVNGTVVTLTFRVKSDAVFAAQSIRVELKINDKFYSASANVSVACKHKFSSWSKVDGSNHTHKCSICGVSETKAHTYDHGCDSKCNDCDAKRTTSHNYKTEWSSTGEYHFHECSICGDWKDDERHTPGDPATEESPQICTVCERILTETLEHVHELDSNPQSDETGHWYHCAKCEEKAEFAEHVYLFDCDALCDVCGYERATEVEHVSGTQWVSDDNGHWHQCTVCQEKTDEAAHTGDLNVAEPKCDVCAYAMGHEHLYEEKWSSHAAEHWHECVCGDKKDVEAHTWDEGVVTEAPYRDKEGTKTYTCTVCGETDTAIIIETSRDLMPWMIACGALGVVVLAMGISLIVIIAKVNKKSTGKYAMR